MLVILSEKKPFQLSTLLSHHGKGFYGLAVLFSWLSYIGFNYVARRILFGRGERTPNLFQIIFEKFFEATGFAFNRVSFVSINLASIVFWFCLFILVEIDITRIIVEMTGQTGKMTSLRALNASGIDIFYSVGKNISSDLIR